MSQNEELTQDTLSEDKYEEEWIVVLNTGGRYQLSKKQAWTIQEAIARGERGIVMFKSFSIPMPYVAEFYRKRRFVKGEYSLPSSTKEEAWTDKDRERAIKRLKEIKEKFTIK